MTDIARTTSLSVRRFYLPRIKFPMLAIAAAVEGYSACIFRTMRMVYVDPFIGQRRLPEKSINADLEGRDPNW